MLHHIKELVELENSINFDDNKKIGIILTDNDLEKMLEQKNTTIKTIYLGHNVILDNTALSFFEKKDITIINIPQYYYEED